MKSFQTPNWDEILTQDELRKWVSYDPETGEFRWLKKPARRIAVGSIVGCRNPKGYVRMSINRRFYAAHRLAWFWVHGRWPDGDIDHIDRNPSNNRISNLRECTKSQNNVNKPSKNKTGYRGVTFHAPSGLFAASIKADRASIFLGYFKSAKKAHEAYCDASRTVHGAFSSTDCYSSSPSLLSPSETEELDT